MIEFNEDGGEDGDDFIKCGRSGKKKVMVFKHLVA